MHTTSQIHDDGPEWGAPAEQWRQAREDPGRPPWSLKKTLVAVGIAAAATGGATATAYAVSSAASTSQQDQGRGPGAMGGTGGQGGAPGAQTGADGAPLHSESVRESGDSTVTTVLQTGTVEVGAVKRSGDQVITQIFRLQFESAANMVGVLRPLISPNNTINANPGSNTLVVTDYADNLQRISQMIAAMDVP